MKWMGTFLILLFLCQVAPHPHTAHPHAEPVSTKAPCAAHASGHDGEHETDTTHHAHDLTHHQVIKTRLPNPIPDAAQATPLFTGPVEVTVAAPSCPVEDGPVLEFPGPRRGHTAPRASRAPPTRS